MPLTKLLDLAFEIDGDTINLEQDAGAGEVHYVTLHSLHLRMLAEQAGLLPARDGNCHSDSMANAWQAQATRLARQLRRLSERIDKQHTQLLYIAEKGRECVDEECAYAEASYELAKEFVGDLDALPEVPAVVTVTTAANDSQCARLLGIVDFADRLRRDHGDTMRGDAAMLWNTLDLVIGNVREAIADAPENRKLFPVFVEKVEPGSSFPVGGAVDASGTGQALPEAAQPEDVGNVEGNAPVTVIPLPSDASDNHATPRNAEKRHGTPQAQMKLEGGQ